jgi:hypothetical protein
MELIEVGDEQQELYYRDIMPCIRALFGNPQFANDLIMVPEHHYKDATKQTRIYSEMNTGNWWWDKQVS